MLCVSLVISPKTDLTNFALLRSFSACLQSHPIEETCAHENQLIRHHACRIVVVTLNNRIFIILALPQIHCSFASQYRSLMKIKMTWELDRPVGAAVA